MVRIVDLPTTGTVDSESFVPVFQNGKTKKIAATSLGGGGGSVNDQIHTATSKTTPADADELGIVDSAATWSLKRLTFANLKAWIAGLFVSKAGDTINGNLSVAGNVLVTNGVLGYGVGAGGTVTQTTSKSTSVALNKPSGSITLHNSTIAAGASVMFDMSNTYAKTGCMVMTNIDLYGTPNYWSYRIEPVAVGGGQITFRLTNLHSGALTAAEKINFVILQGATT